jgi:hypothetical protein
MRTYYLHIWIFKTQIYFINIILIYNGWIFKNKKKVFL